MIFKKCALSHTDNIKTPIAGSTLLGN